MYCKRTVSYEMLLGEIVLKMSKWTISRLTSSASILQTSGFCIFHVGNADVMWQGFSCVSEVGSCVKRQTVSQRSSLWKRSYRVMGFNVFCGWYCVSRAILRVYFGFILLQGSYWVFGLIVCRVSFSVSGIILYMEVMLYAGR